MSRSLASRGCFATTAVVALLAHARDARACGGGMFNEVAVEESVSVTEHAVVVSISPDRTVIWDRISYSGAPSDFAWVMPVAPGSTLELASAAWIEALIGGTTPITISPSVECDSGSGCVCDKDGGSAGGGYDESDDVTVTHRAEIGPYLQETIKSDTPGAISKWLTGNGYAIPASISPILDDYAAQGMEFLALRLKPGSDVSDMQPVRVRMAGGITTFPMRMLAAGAKDRVPIKLAVIAEGRYEAKGFSNVTIRGKDIFWDFTTHRSDYFAVRSIALSANDGKTWLTSFAEPRVLFYASDQDFWLEGNYDNHSIGALYFSQGQKNGEYGTNCPSKSYLKTLAGSDGMDEVVELCSDLTLPCSTLQAGQINSDLLACGSLDDLATALVGMHPRDVWVTRLEAELPVAALASDLTLVPSAGQAEVNRVLRAKNSAGDPCSGDAYATLKTPARHRRGAVPLGVMAAAVGLAFARKSTRRRPQHLR